MLLIGTLIPIVNSSNQIANERYNYGECRCDSDIGNGIEIVQNNNLEKPEYFTQNLDINGVPDYFNWKDFGGKDWTTPAKNQYLYSMCGSCWTFATNGALESVINIKEGSAVIDADLSEQYILSCLPQAAKTPGEGCNGGYPFDAYYFIKDTSPDGNNCNGVILETCFPYGGFDNISCDDKCVDWEDYLVPISDFGYFFSSENQSGLEKIKSYIMLKGPLAISMLYNNRIWQWGLNHHDPNEYYTHSVEYGGGHDIVVSGWKDDPDIINGGYWIIKNSEGDDWGYDGYFNLEYGFLGSTSTDEDMNTTYVVWVDYDPNSYTWNNEQNIPNSPDINGPISGEFNKEYEYTFKSIDPEGKDVKYYISWGNGDWEWTDYYPSGEDVIVKHTWDDEGDYSIFSLAMNEDGIISPWSDLSISMPKIKSLNIFNPWLFRLIQRFPILELLL